MNYDRWVDIKLLFICGATLKAKREIPALGYAGEVKSKKSTLEPADLKMIALFHTYLK